MAAKKASPTRTRNRRNTESDAADLLARHVPDPVKAVTAALEAERGRLMNAEALLHCVVLAMNETDPSDGQGPYYQGVLGIACDLLSQAINQLDSVRMRALLEKSTLPAKYEVKEGAVAYVH
jgi:hypothetical protein